MAPTHPRTVTIAPTFRTDDVVSVDPRYLKAQYRHVTRWTVRAVEPGRLHLESAGGARTTAFTTACTVTQPAREAIAAQLW